MLLQILLLLFGRAARASVKSGTAACLAASTAGNAAAVSATGGGRVLVRERNFIIATQAPLLCFSFSRLVH